jgi:hypothetical protein
MKERKKENESLYPSTHLYTVSTYYLPTYVPACLPASICVPTSALFRECVVDKRTGLTLHKESFVSSSGVLLRCILNDHVR